MELLGAHLHTTAQHKKGDQVKMMDLQVDLGLSFAHIGPLRQRFCRALARFRTCGIRISINVVRAIGVCLVRPRAGAGTKHSKGATKCFSPMRFNVPSINGMVKREYKVSPRRANSRLARWLGRPRSGLPPYCGTLSNFLEPKKFHPLKYQSPTDRG